MFQCQCSRSQAANSLKDCSVFRVRFYGNHDRKVNSSTPALASLLHPRVRYFTISNYLCMVESNKQQIKEVRSKIQPEN